MIKRDENNKIINCHSNIAQMSIPQLMWFNKNKILPALITSLEYFKEGMIKIMCGISGLIFVILFPALLIYMSYIDRKDSREYMEQWGKSWK